MRASMELSMKKREILNQFILCHDLVILDIIHELNKTTPALSLLAVRDACSSPVPLFRNIVCLNTRYPDFIVMKLYLDSKTKKEHSHSNSFIGVKYEGINGKNEIEVKTLYFFKIRFIRCWDRDIVKGCKRLFEE